MMELENEKRNALTIREDNRLGRFSLKKSEGNQRKINNNNNNKK